MSEASRLNSGRSFNRFTPSRVLAYGVATASVVLAAILQIVINELSGSQAVYLLFFGGIMFAAWYGGLGPGIWATLLAGLMADYFFLEPLAQFGIPEQRVAVSFTLFIIEGVMISILNELRVKAQAQEHEQRDSLQTTLRSIGDGVIATDASGRITFLNPVGEELTGWTSAEAAGQDIATVFNIINETTRQAAKIPITDALKYGTITGLANHTLLITKDGREIPIDDSGAPIKNLEGKVIGSVLVFRNVDAQRQAARNLETLELVMSSIDEAFLILDHNWRFIYANDRAGEMATLTQGISKEELLRLTTDEAYPELADSEVLTKFRQAAAEKTNVQFEAYVPEYDRWYEYRVFHTSFGLAAFTADISDRKKIEERIQLLQQIAADLMEAATPKQVAEVLINRCFELLRPHATTVMMVSENQREIELVNHRGLTPEMAQQYQRVPLSASLPLTDAIREEEIVWIGSLEEYRARYPDVAINAQASTGSQALLAVPMIVNKEVIGGIGMSFPRPHVFDEDERDFLTALAQQAAQAMARAQQAESAATIQERQRLARELHDSVSQALFSASMMAESLPRLWESQPENAAKRTQEVVTLNRGVLAEMRTLLLELRPEAIVRYQLSDLIKQLVEATQARRKVQVELDVDEITQPLPPDVQVTFYRIAQESLNNIAKHSQATHLDVGLRLSDDAVTLSIQDNGQGFKLDDTSSGLGMSAMRERAQAIGASLVIESEPANGTKTTLRWRRELKFDVGS